MMVFDSIMQWNMQSYRQKFSNLKCLLHKYAPLCVCLQETLLNPDNLQHYPPSQYTMVHSRRARQDGHERGAAVLIHKRIQYNVIQLNTDLQAAAVTIHFQRKFTICSLYLPHHNITYAQLDNLVQQLPIPFLLLGDVNATNTLWGSPTTNTRGHLFDTLILNHSITILNDGSPTHHHIQTGTFSIIDIALCSSSRADDFEYEVISDSYSSDHFPVRVAWKQPPPLMTPNPRFKIEQAKWKEFTELTHFHNDNIKDIPIEDLLKQITHTILQAADSTIPKTSGNLRRPPVPWWNDNCTKARRNRIRAERAFNRNPTIENRIARNRTRAFAQYTLNSSRKQSFQLYVQSINQRSSLHEVWKKVRKIEGKFSPSPSPVLRDSDGVIHSSPKECANIFAKHYSNVSSSDNYTLKFQRYKEQSEKRTINFESADHFDYNLPISMIELKQALSTVQESSPGEDGITYSMLKHCHPTLMIAILCLMNRIFHEHTFPEAWRVTITIPIPKPTGASEEPKNSRPISLSSCLCKAMEKILNARLMWFLEKGNHINITQSGFRKKRSTTDHLIHIETALRQSLADKQHTIAVFFDLTKAYDMAWRYGIIRSLHEFGLRGSLPIFIQNFLTDRYFKVRVGSSLSERFPLSEGIPQGSVLSCTCFIIAINTITSAIPQTVHSLLYVDDLTIYCTGSNINMIQRQLQLAINTLQTWSQKTGFKFSDSKTVSMHICRKHNCSKSAPHLTINKTPIKCVNSTKFLGLTLDSSLTWKPHITTVKKKTNKSLDLLKKLSHSKYGSDSKTLLRLYIMLIKPTIEYGLEAYASAAPTYLNSLYAIQNAAIRIATGAFRSSPVVSLHALTSVLPSNYSYHLKQLNLYMRLIVNPTHPMNDLVIDQEDLNADVIQERTPPKSFLSRASSLHLLYQLDTSRILGEFYSQKPPWKICCITVCTDLFEFTKKDFPPNVMRNIFNNHATQHENTTCIYTDGSKTERGVGYAFKCQQHTHQCHILDIASIYSAELLAIRDAIDYAINTIRIGNITILTDSRSAIQAISSPFSPNPIVQKIQDLIIDSSLTFCFCWTPSHIGIPGNEQVDILAKESINLQLTPLSLPRSDHKCHIKNILRNSWQQSWNNIADNKLREIQPTIPRKYNDFQQRSWSIKLARLRLGHTRLTHEYLMKKEPRPTCDYCDEIPLTVKHILAECPRYNEKRLIFGCPGPPTLASILDPKNCGYDGSLRYFLQSIDIINKI